MLFTHEFILNLFLGGACCFVLALAVNHSFVVCVGEPNFPVSLGEKARRISVKKVGTSSLLVAINSELATLLSLVLVTFHSMWGSRWCQVSAVWEVNFVDYSLCIVFI